MNNTGFQNTLNLLLLGQSNFKGRHDLFGNDSNLLRSPVDQILSCSINCLLAMTIGTAHQFLQLNDGQASAKR